MPYVNLPFFFLNFHFRLTNHSLIICSDAKTKTINTIVYFSNVNASFKKFHLGFYVFVVFFLSSHCLLVVHAFFFCLGQAFVYVLN